MNVWWVFCLWQSSFPAQQGLVLVKGVLPTQKDTRGSPESMLDVCIGGISCQDWRYGSIWRCEDPALMHQYEGTYEPTTAEPRSFERPLEATVRQCDHLWPNNLLYGGCTKNLCMGRSWQEQDAAATLLSSLKRLQHRQDPNGLAGGLYARIASLRWPSRSLAEWK